jgi:hypothetical protein
MPDVVVVNASPLIFLGNAGQGHFWVGSACLLRELRRRLTDDFHFFQDRHDEHAVSLEVRANSALGEDEGLPSCIHHVTKPDAVLTKQTPPRPRP